MRVICAVILCFLMCVGANPCMLFEGPVVNVLFIDIATPTLYEFIKKEYNYNSAQIIDVIDHLDISKDVYISFKEWNKLWDTCSEKYCSKMNTLMQASFNDYLTFASLVTKYNYITSYDVYLFEVDYIINLCNLQVKW